MSPWSKQQPTRPTSQPKSNRPIPPSKSARPKSPPKPIRTTSPPKSTLSKSPAKPARPTSPPKSSRPSSPPADNSSPKKSIWARRNSDKQAQLIPESTKSNKVPKKNKSELHNDKGKVPKGQPNNPSGSNDTQTFFGRMFRKQRKSGNNDIVVNRVQDLTNDRGSARNKRKYTDANVLVTLKDKDTGKTNRRRNNSQERESFSSFDKVEKKNKFKRMLRRQVWRMSKGSIKGNKRLSTLLAENHINIDNIKPEEIDLTLINVDALGIENRLLKRTVTWLLK